MLRPRSSSLSISFTARVGSRFARPQEPRARPVGPLFPVATPGATVVLRPAEFRGFGVTVEGAGALGVTPGLRIGGGGPCGIGIVRSPGSTADGPAAAFGAAAFPAWGNESASASAAAISPVGIFLRMACLLEPVGATLGKAVVFQGR